MYINTKQLNNLHTLLMKCAHRILGFHSYKMNTTSILKQLNWLSLPQLIIHESLKLTHKITFDHTPPALTKYFAYNLVRSDVARKVRKPSPKIMYKSAKLKNSFIYRSTFIYNTLPYSLRILNKKQFAKQSKDHIFRNFSLKHIPKIDDTP